MRAVGRHTVREGRFWHRRAELVYDDAGEGPLAVYAHGGFVSQATEDRMGLFDWAPVLDAGQRLVRYDARAHGRSTGDPVDTDYTYPSLADDLLALLDHLGAAEPVAAMGASMGCGTVLHAAVQAPDRFSRLVLLIPPTAWTTREAHAQANRESADTIEREGVDAWLAAKGTTASPRSRSRRSRVPTDAHRAGTAVRPARPGAVRPALPHGNRRAAPAGLDPGLGGRPGPPPVDRGNAGPIAAARRPACVPDARRHPYMGGTHRGVPDPAMIGGSQHPRREGEPLQRGIEEAIGGKVSATIGVVEVRTRPGSGPSRRPRRRPVQVQPGCPSASETVHPPEPSSPPATPVRVG